MNSEELEQSLRTEFESYLKDVLADMKQEASEFQEKIESEFEKQRSQLSEVFEEFSKKIGEDKEIDVGFKESVTEHLKLARDEGAKITAAAIAEAEDMREEEEAPANFSSFRDAITDISTKESQSEILKSLVHHASQYTTRGAFFIVKNKHLVGWRVFGTEGHPTPDVVKEVYFPVSSNSSLTEAIETLATVAGSYGIHEDDSMFLDKLEFGEPAGMYSIPLVVRGRGVAVLYADRGTDEGNVNVEALESLIRVAGLTVDVVASTAGAKKVSVEEEGVVPAESGYSTAEEESFSEVQSEPVVAEQNFDATTQFEDYSPPVVEETLEAETPAFENEYQPVSPEIDAEQGSSESDSVSWSDSVETAAPEYDESSFSTQSEATESYEVEAPTEATESYEVEAPAEAIESYEVEASPEVEQTNEYASDYSGFETVDKSEVQTDDFSVQETEVDNSYEIDSSETASDSYEIQAETESTGFETSQFNASEMSPTDVDTSAANSYEFETNQTASSFEQTVEAPVETVEPVETVAATPTRSRFGDRNVDLPIEVEENERRHHNDARRFARLLVSEIKLYNEQKVKEGRESADLYERLREAIDRSREMYEKRVQPPVAAKFDYFNYELVSTLAEGDEGKLGNHYPGANV